MNLSKLSTEHYKALLNHYGSPITPLRHKNIEQLAIAVILSAQCTDARVNQITPKLFSRYKNIGDFARASQEEVEKIIYSAGFYKMKTMHIIALARILEKNYEGKIPDNFEALLKLPGIGRKSANVIMSSGFNKICGIVVDTHVKRLSFRLGYTSNKNPDKIEADLMQIWPKKIWNPMSLLLIFHGRKFCKAQNPRCETCFLTETCRFFKKC
ncbi:MAG: endonuclease III [Spirochaetia bacterium]|nr:endonuclease III [Spirochaetia bacterium]